MDHLRQESQLYGIVPHDGTTLAAGLIGLLAAGALACDLPARRAARLDAAAPSCAYAALQLRRHVVNP